MSYSGSVRISTERKMDRYIPEVQLQAVKQLVSTLLEATLGKPSAAQVHVHVPPLPPASTLEDSLMKLALHMTQWSQVPRDT